ncbi:type VI secretion protein [Streptomyces sp. NPDC089915]|uniref:type VI secretion protein n=1 Tax=Streptomyces sp. NPDC089915 TaxID=3155186 RepID=UPI00342A481B
MHDGRGTEPRARGGGIPDGALVGLLAFLLGLAVLVWSATGLAALFAKGAWPATVTFTRTPGAVRALIAQPHDIPGAWPDTNPTALSGWGLFWGLFISQLLVLLVLTIFTMGVIARTKARRTDARAAARNHTRTTAPNHDRSQDRSPIPGQESAPSTKPVPEPALRTGRRQPAHSELRSDAPPGPDRTPDLDGPAGPGHDTAGVPTPAPTRSLGAAPATGNAPHPDATPHPHPATAPHRDHPGTGTPAPAEPRAAAPMASAHAPVSAPAAHPRDRDGRPPAQEAYRYGFGYAPPARTTAPPPAHRLAYAPPAERHHLAAQAISGAEGSVLVVTSSPALWQDTKDARAKLGPVLLYDPSHLCDTPARMHWNPADGCADRDTAAARAIALLAPVRPQARLDAAVSDTAETLLRSWLQAAALDGLPFKQLARWAQGNGSQEPVRILRTHPQAAPGAAGELESALIAHPERREQAQYLTARALSCLTSIHIREACNPNRTDALTLASFAAEGGTLYVVGESVEDPRTRPGAMPLLTALASHVVEHGRRMAARSSRGRLDPPMTLVLEDVAAVAPVPGLPELLDDERLPLLALCRSREQARSRWPEWPVA